MASAHSILFAGKLTWKTTSNLCDSVSLLLLSLYVLVFYYQSKTPVVIGWHCSDSTLFSRIKFCFNAGAFNQRYKTNFNSYMYTYIIGHYNPSHTTHVACIDFICKWRDLQFNVDSQLQIFEILYHGRLIYSQEFLTEI